MEILAIIPARKGSKRLPRKNTKLLDGKPLIEYAIDDAINCKYINDIIVTSDDDEVEKIAKKKNVIFRNRPKELCGDKSDSQSFIDDILTHYGHKWDIIVLLQPTSPLREVYHINECIEAYINGHFTSVMTVMEISPHTYYPNGAVYVFKDKIYTDNMGMILMPNDESIDINTMLDFNIASLIMKERRNFE